MLEPFNASQPEPEFAAFVAIDWADKRHVWALQEAAGNKRETGEVEQSPEAIEVWASGLAARFGSRPIAVGLEQSRGALLYTLTKYQHLILYPIHPTMLSKFREAMRPSGAKDDPTDADLLLDILTQHRKRLRVLKPDTVPTRTLQFLTESRRALVDERTGLSNSLTGTLKLYFPQMVQWFDRVDSPLVGALLERWPTLEQLRQQNAATLRQFFLEHDNRGEARLEQRLEQIRVAMPATLDQAVIQSAARTVRILVRVIQTLREGIAELDKEIDRISKAHPDYPVMNSFPGAGQALVPRIIAGVGTQRDRFASAAELQAYTGIAPVTERSGGSKRVHMRYACPKFLRQTFHEWAGHSIAWSEWARLYYQQQRNRGKSHHRAVRALAFKWQRIVFRCWQNGKPYDERIYVAALKKRGSPVGALIGLDIQWKKVAGFSKLEAASS
jgi:transposase